MIPYSFLHIFLGPCVHVRHRSFASLMTSLHLGASLALSTALDQDKYPADPSSASRTAIHGLTCSDNSS